MLHWLPHRTLQSIWQPIMIKPTIFDYHSGWILSNVEKSNLTKEFIFNWTKLLNLLWKYFPLYFFPWRLYEDSGTYCKNNYPLLMHNLKEHHMSFYERILHHKSYIMHNPKHQPLASKQTDWHTQNLIYFMRRCYKLFCHWLAVRMRK